MKVRLSAGAVPLFLYTITRQQGIVHLHQGIALPHPLLTTTVGRVWYPPGIVHTGIPQVTGTTVTGMAAAGSQS